MNKKVISWSLSVLLVVVFGFLIPAPKGLNPAAMRYIGLFLAFLVLLVTQVVDDWVACLLILALMYIMKVAKIPEVFAPFSGSVVWLVIGVFMVAVGIGKSGLSNRIALGMLRLFPSSYRGQVAGFVTTTLAISPLIPSTYAKANLMAPLATSVTEELNLSPHSKGAAGLFSIVWLGGYLMGNAFLSGSANVAILMGFIPDMKAQLTWVGWFSACSIWLLTMIIGTYIFAAYFCKPESSGSLPPGYIQERFEALGPMSTEEKWCAIIMALALLAWLTQAIHGIDAGQIAILAGAAMALAGLINKNSFLTKIPWNMIVFIGTLLSIAALMSSLGISAWIAKIIGPHVGWLVSSPYVLIAALCIITWLLRFVILSMLATLTILFAAFSPLMPQAGVSLFVLVFVVYLAANCWNTIYMNPFIVGTVAATGEKFVSYKDVQPASVAYMVICLVGFLASVPLWQLLGLIT